MSKVFISYARANQQSAEVLYSTLTEWGHDVWMDVHRLEPGRSWVGDIDNALRESEMVVGLLTPEGLDSPNVMAEWFWALENDRKLILMRVADYSREKVSHKLVHLQWIDYTKDEAGGFGRLRSVVEKGTPLSEAASGSIAPLDRHKTVAKTRWLFGKAPMSSNRERMLQRVHAYWVEGVLHQAVNEANQFNVGYELAPDAVLKHVDYSDCLLPANTDFGKVFKHLGAEVLILGSPGSGKTILLLQLAEQLLSNAVSDDQAPIPIVLNLSGWSHKREPIHEWIVNEAAMSYQVPRKAIRRCVEDEVIIPLFDGLDEVLPEFREECVDAINHFHHNFRGVGLGVCSRIGDYELLKAKIDFRSAILIQPLDECQVHAVTSRPELDALRVTLEQEPVLVDMSRTPYLLNVMSYAYADKSQSELRLSSNDSSEDARRAHMLDTYINRRLGETRDRRTMSAQRMRSLLAWLASNMMERGQIVFHIESLQMDWLTRFRDRWLYCFLSRTLFGLVGLGTIWSLAWMMGYTAFRICSGFHSNSRAYFEGAVGTLGQLTIGVVGLCLLLFYLAGLCAAAIEWVRSTIGSTLRRRLVTAIVSCTAMGLMIGLCVSICIIIFTFSNALRSLDFSHMNFDLVRDTLVCICLFVCFQLIPSLVCSASAMISNRLKLRSSMPTYAAVGAALFLMTVIHDLFFGSAALFVGGVAAGVASVLMGTLMVALPMAMTSLFGDQIQTAEQIQWRWNKRAGKLCAAPWIALNVLLFVYVLYFIVVQSPHDLLNWRLYLIFSVGLFTVFISAAIGGAVFGFQRAEGIHRRLIPNEGVFRSVRMGSLLGLGFGVIGFLFSAIITAIFFWLKGREALYNNLMGAMPPLLTVSAFPAAIGAMLGGFDVPVKHFVLRALLTMGEQIPWRFRHFLDVCSSQLMLRRVGGGYIFVHRYLLEHFARIHQEAQPKITGRH